MARKQIIPFFIPHYGCEFECVFCNQYKITQAKPILGGIPASLKLELSKLISGEYEIAFYGGSFTALSIEEQHSFLEPAASYIRKNPNCSIRLSTRPDCIDEETVSRLKSYGVTTIELGAQSMCNHVLALANRGHTCEDVVRASRIIKKSNISLILQMMTGLPGDTFEGAIDTARKIAELKPEGVRIYPTVVIEDTKLHDMWKLGTYKAHSINEAVEFCSEICLIFDRANIKIIRLGLNPTDELSSGKVIAGAYHPGLGEMVYSRVCRRLVEKKLREVIISGQAIERIEIIVSKGFLSKMIGQNKENVKYFKEKYAVKEVVIIESEKASASAIVPEIKIKL